jgi:hypothetical protein
VDKEIFTHFPINCVVIIEHDMSPSHEYCTVTGYCIGQQNQILLKLNTICKYVPANFYVDPLKTKVTNVVSGVCLTLATQ